MLHHPQTDLWRCIFEDMTLDEGPEQRQKVVIYTDGGCRGNPGCGAWAAILSTQKHRRVLAGVAPSTTNNQMELKPVIEGLNALKRRCDVRIVSDSKYVVSGITEWIEGWKRRGWKTAGKKPVKNRDLWIELDEAASKHEIKWEWTRGHAGHPENEKCDELVNELMDRFAAGEDPEDIRINERENM